MSIYTNTGLVKHCESALKLPNVYMNSMILREITPAYYNSVLKFLRDNGANLDNLGYTKERLNYLEAKIVGKGYYGVDCVCLVKSYYWSGKADGGVGSPKYTGSNDLNAGAMYQRATVKGPIKTMPDVPGLILYCKTHPHIGVYVGNGETIESTLGSRGDGIVKKKLDSFWEYWFQCPFIDYPDPTNDISTGDLKVGDKVRVIEGAKYWNGEKPFDFVYKTTYIVNEIGKKNPNRIVIENDRGMIIGAIDISNLKKV